MGLDLQAVVNSPLGVVLALGLGRAVPPAVGYPLGRFVAGQIAARRTTAMVMAVRLNQWVVSGTALSAEQLDRAVLDTFRHAARCQYDLYHNMDNPDALERMIHVSDRVECVLERVREAVEGTVIVAPHLSNFDFVWRAAARRGLRAQAITPPDPRGGYRRQNAMRASLGMDVTPASVASLRQAVMHLREGGTVLTGVDRPVASSRYRPLFFGRQAALPVLHVHMALKAGAPVLVAAAIMRPDGVYETLVSDLIRMKSYPERRQEIIRNAEAVLEIVADYVRRAPRQWSMFYPVWPEVAAEVPPPAGLDGRSRQMIVHEGN